MALLSGVAACYRITDDPGANKRFRNIGTRM
jgi:hypothetical protein